MTETVATEFRQDRSHWQSRPTKQKASSIIDRAPPSDSDAEKALLGSIMLDPECLNDVVMVVRNDDFYDDANRKIYSQMREMHDSGRKVDVALLVNQLKGVGDYDLVGGAAYLALLANSVPNAAHALYYADIVSSKSTMRRLIEASSEILRDAYDESNDPKELVSQAEQKILSVQDERHANSATTIADALKGSMARIDARMKGTHEDGGVSTHFDDFDEQTGGMHNGELIILAARPSMGKTAFAMNIAGNVALLGQQPVLFISLEMAAIELADRLLISVAEIDGKKLRSGSLSQEDRKRLVESAMEVSNAPLYVDDSPSRTVSEVAAVARRINQQEMRNNRRLSLIVIDYLQLLEPDNPKDPRQEQVAKIARRLKMMARELEVPILCLSQLNRQSEEGKDHTPRLSHLRESGAIEQDADVVMFVHREEYYHRGDDAAQFAGEAQIIIAKQRNGPIGDVEMVWQREFMRFRNRAAKRHEDFDMSSDFQSPGGF